MYLKSSFFIENLCNSYILVDKLLKTIFISITANNQKIGWGFGIAFGLSGMIIKQLHLSGIELIPRDRPPVERAFFEYKRSFFTNRPDPEGNPNI